ncbi:hypothetical protein B9G98_01634 [Wickerhamiella sorbophila]|uniref:Checkpoint protein n=1 Tax=Wickerhamiella sorbophila TaxID=45607 RepID=A0A2T0FGA8_9ASCO|nr:hypothetical protein B9G98_01634 [Wickerhamiella sorbophila]PRT54014.1 hypothetical protein B9G98_01634 [Wickerhamiella sorbophila]
MAVGVLLEARLREPLFVRDVCSALASINPSGLLVADRNRLVFSAQSSMQSATLWAELAIDSMLEHISHLTDFAIEIHFESFHRMFRSFNSMGEVFIRVTPRSTTRRVVGLRINNESDGPEMIVRQRINALEIPLSAVPTEPIISSLDMCCELALGQLPQIVRVAEKYRQLDHTLDIKLSSDHVFSVIIQPAGVQINTSWTVIFPEVLPGTQESQSTPRSALPMFGTASITSISVQARDWYNAIAHCQQLARRVVVGIVGNEVLAVFCYPHTENEENVLTFYLSSA